MPNYKGHLVGGVIAYGALFFAVFAAQKTSLLIAGEWLLFTLAGALVHVIDISHKDWQQQYHTVNKTIAELDASHIPIIEVYNKVDQINSIELEEIKKKITHDNIVFTQATTKEGVIDLVNRLKEIVITDQEK